MTGDLYVQSVIENLPYGSPLREQIAMELRSNIAERVAHGEPLDGVLRQLGDPLTLAESYLASIPLTAASASRRLMAKLVDVVLVMLVAVGVAAAMSMTLPPHLAHFVPIVCVLGGLCGFISYTVAIDALFVLFTERKQRAFEILSKTRAVALLVLCLLLTPVSVLLQ